MLDIRKPAEGEAHRTSKNRYREQAIVFIGNFLCALSCAISRYPPAPTWSRQVKLSRNRV